MPKIAPAYAFHGESYYRLASDDPDVTPFLVVDDRQRVTGSWTHRRKRRATPVVDSFAGDAGLPL